MNYDELFVRLGDQAFFDLAAVSLFFEEPRNQVVMQLHRWVRDGRLLSLRRGMYAWPERYRKTALNPAVAANALLRPSYLSGLWAMGWYGLIPEMVTVYTSVSSRGVRRFENELGVFEYRHVKRELFFGYEAVAMEGSRVLVALPEKALLDYWHLSPGEWTAERLEAMRFQFVSRISTERLAEFAVRAASPRLERAVKVWRVWAEQQEEGTVNL